MSAKTVVFFPEGAFGPTNNCVGIGEQLRARGHRVVFIVEESFAGTLEARGFEERLMRLGPAPEVEEAPGQFWKDFIRDTAPVFRKPTIEQLASSSSPPGAALLDGVRYVEPRLREIFDELEPDVIVEDNVPGFPAVVTAAAAVGADRLLQPARAAATPTCRPSSPATRPADRSRWDEFDAEYDRTHRPLWAGVQRVSAGGRARRRSPTWSSSTPRRDLNLYLYPGRGSTTARARPLDGIWHRLESCVRSSDADFELPERRCATATAR